MDRPAHPNRHTAQPPVLCLDRGNTRLKGALVQGRRVLERWQGNATAEGVDQLCAWASPFRHHYMGLAIVDVGPTQLLWWQQINAPTDLPRWRITGETPSPVFTNLYATPHTLGADRWAALHGAWELQRQLPLLVVDLGTALTYDYVDASGSYRGGGILPGLQMQLDALHAYSARLPGLKRASEAEFPPLLGASTHTAMQAGAAHSQIAVIRHLIRELTALQPASPPGVVLTGGDTDYIAPHLDYPHIREPDLVLLGAGFLARSLWHA